MDEKTVREYGETIMGVCNVLGLLRILSDAAYNLPDEAPQMAHMANALEAAADLLERYYIKLAETEDILSTKGG